VGVQPTPSTPHLFSRLGPDFTLADAYDAAYLGVGVAEVEDVDLMGAAERQALNAAMAEWYGIG